MTSRRHRGFQQFIINANDKLILALNKINDNKSKIIFIVDDEGVLLGSLSDGDIRRVITKFGSLEINRPISEVMNKNVIFGFVDSSHSKNNDLFNNDCEIIPLVDKLKRVVAILNRNSADRFKIGNRFLSKKDPVFIIAEIGNNHNGNIVLAKKLVDYAKIAGADAVKFQLRSIKNLYVGAGASGTEAYDLGAQYTYDQVSKFSLDAESLFNIFDYCYENDILPLCTPWDMESAKSLNLYGIEGFKIASADLTNHQLISYLGTTGKPIICSTGMSTESEIIKSVNVLKNGLSPYALLHCNSTYPTPYKDVNLLSMMRLESLSNGIYGYSGHERGYMVCIAAVALGAKIVEKHLTIDRSMEGNDHKVSLLPEEFKSMVHDIRCVETSMGINNPRELTQGEMINRESLAKSLVINSNLKKGEVIRREMIEILSPGSGLQPDRLEELIGKKAIRNFSKGDFFYESDLKSESINRSSYSISLPFGVPVRYHDFSSLTSKVDMDFVEFHMSYQDLKIKSSAYLKKNSKLNYSVHAPELFEGDHLLDLSNEDDQYRRKSIDNLKQVAKITRELRDYFPASSAPNLIVNVGGWNPTGFIENERKIEKYRLVEESLREINFSGINVAIQTMPPYPWHFGGQSHHNLFVDPFEIAEFCSKSGYGICLDVSHSMMACSYYKWEFDAFLDQVLPHTIHMHISDAKGVDGEGVKIGEGDVDFYLLKQKIHALDRVFPMIPEIWQGHKDAGAGFWEALAYLESIKF